MFVTLFMMLLFLIAGITFSMGRGSSLIAGYNTMSEEEKAEIDRVSLTKFMGKIMFALVGSMVFWLVSSWVEIELIFYVGLMIFMSIVLYALITMNNKERFKRK